MLRYQKNTRIQLLATVAVLLLALWLDIAPTEWALIIPNINCGLVGRIHQCCRGGGSKLGQSQLSSHGESCQGRRGGFCLAFRSGIYRNRTHHFGTFANT